MTMAGRCGGLMIAISTALMATPVSVAQEALKVPRIIDSISLDGVLDEAAWRKAARLTHQDFTRWVANQYTLDPDEFSLRLFHDGNKLYVALASYDRFVEPAATEGNSDGLYSFSVITTDSQLLHYRLRWVKNLPQAAGEMTGPGKWGARLRGPFADTKHHGGGYVLEFAIPLATLGWRPGGEGRINIILHDHDGKPHAAYNNKTVHFARFAYGSLDNEARNSYRPVRLAP